MAAGRYKRSIVWKPQPKQAAFMRRCEDEALYGGAAGGGKSDALVIEALRQVDVPHYRGLIVRKTYPQLSELIDKTMQYYRPVFPKARYNASSHVWTFPSGAKIYFGSMFRTQDKYNYQGKAFDFIGVDELTHFTWEEYSYLMSRNRPTGPGTVVYMQARRIREAEQNDPMLKGRVIQGVADPAIFNESQGESIAQMQEKYPYFVTWRPGDHTRIAAPGSRYSGRSRKIRCWMLSSFWLSTISRAESRGDAGSCAMSSLGKSYQKSFFNILCICLSDD